MPDQPSFRSIADTLTAHADAGDLLNESFTIPVLGLRQPWACLVEIGAKPYETRHFPIPTRLLGKRVAIQATARPCFVGFNQETLEAIDDAFGRCAWNRWLPRGCVTCTAILAESLPVEKVTHDLFGDYSPGRFAWRLEDVRPVSPHIPLKGRRMIGWSWRVPAEWLYAFADVRP